jgi:hypothetical protein
LRRATPKRIVGTQMPGLEVRQLAASSTGRRVVLGAFDRDLMVADALTTRSFPHAGVAPVTRDVESLAKAMARTLKNLERGIVEPAWHSRWA